MPFDQHGKERLQDFQLAAAYVAAHPRFRELVEELEDSPDVYRSAAGDPKKHLQSRGFDIPDEWTVKLSHESPLTITVCVNSWCLSYTVSVTVTTE
jgi:hypothetical protein